ncbi:pam-b [Scenedesmus sp. PABB004]|nr:pam-b [Scenedesmus sp. PABB004]
MAPAPAAPLAGPADVTAFIEDVNQAYEKVHRAYEANFWSTKMALRGCSAEALAASKNEYDAFLADPARLAAVKQHLDRTDLSEEQAGVLKIMARTFGVYVTEDPAVVALKEKLNAAEAKLQAARNAMQMGYTPAGGAWTPASSTQLRTLLRVAEEEGTRRSVFEGLRAVGPFVAAQGFCEIVKNRNRLARRVGFEDYYDLKVTAAEGFGKARLFEMLDDLEAQTRPLMEAARARLAREKGDAALEPHNISQALAGDTTKATDPYFPFEDAVDVWARTFAGLGIDYQGSEMILDLCDRPSKYPNGFCAWPQPAWRRADGSWVPSVANFTSLATPDQLGSGKTALETLLHEGGHAAHFANVQQRSPFFSQERAPTSVAYAENQSMFLDSLAGDAAWLGRFAVSREGGVMPWGVVEAMHRDSHPYAVFMVRAMLAVPYFEKALYELPEEGVTPEALQALADEIEVKVQGGLASRPLLSVPHILSDESSAYYHGYVLAEMAVHQTRAHFLGKYGAIVDNPQVGADLAACYWRPGNGAAFLDLVAGLTGRPLGSAAWVARLQMPIEELLAKEREDYDAAVKAGPRFKPGSEADINMRVRLVDGDEVIADSADGGLLAATAAFKAWHVARPAMARRAAAWALLLAAAAAARGASLEFEITVPPDVVVKGQDSYICTTLQLPDKPYKVVGVEPLAEQAVVHHILLFGCDVPHVRPKPGQQSTWDCKMAPTCGGFQETIMYGWGRNAPRLDLPRGVGFSVGKGSAVAWVVAQVHYLAERPAGDRSGVKLILQDTPVPFSAGLLSYASWFSIPPRKPHFLVQNSCCYRGFQPLTSFAVRVHTHTMGRAVFMTRLPPTKDGHGHVVASGDPQQPQGFNPVQPQVIWPGDRLTVACDFDSSDKTVAVGAGPTHEHEMCNMYLMVYSPLPHIEMCSDGSSMVDERSPGNMPRAAALLPDPFPLWRPPKPADKLNGSATVLGNVASVAVGPDGTLWALHRGGRVWGADTFDAQERMRDPTPIGGDVVVQMHADTGKVLRRWGAGQFLMPHMISVDRNNSVWVTDVGRHQVLKFSASGQLLLAVGKRGQPGSGKVTLCKPTQVAFLNDGSFLVSDGYCNSRVVRFAGDGRYVAHYALPAGGTMGVAHSVVVDECDGELVVADREGAKAHRFDLDTRELIATVDLSARGKVWALAKGPYGRTIALTWTQGRDAALVDVGAPAFAWALPNSTDAWPHDFALGPAPLPLTGAGDRLLAVFVAPLCAACGAVQKYVLMPAAFGAPDAGAPPPVVVPPGARPVLSHLHAGAGAAAHAGHAAGAGGDDAAEEAHDADADADAADEAAVEAEEEAEDEAEAEQMADPATVERLQAQLTVLQAQLRAARGGGGAGADGDGDTQEFKTVRAGAPARAGGRAGGVAAVVAVSAVVGVAVGGLAVHLLSRAALSRRGGYAPPPGAGAGGGRGGGVANGRAEQQSIDALLRAGVEDDDDAAIARERDRLLAGGGLPQLRSGPAL